MEQGDVNWQPQHLENERIRLAPLTASHFEDLFKIASDPQIWAQHPARERYKKDVFRNFFDGALQSGTAFVIIDQATGRIAGSTRYYDYRPDVPSIAIGYTFLGRSYWGGQYNQASKRLLIDYAFQYVDKVYFHIGSDNIRSQTAISRTGARKVGEVHFEVHGSMVPHYEYVVEKTQEEEN